MPTKDEVRSILPGGKWHEVAMKWVADDAAVLQWAQTTSKHWYDQPPHAIDPFCDGYQWRIKPQVLRYRVALWKASKSSPSYLTVIDQQDIADAHEQSPLFVRWLGGWQEAEK